MFFSTYVLTQKGPLAKIWMAAHWKKISKQDAKVIDLSQVVVSIVDPSVPIALRTSGELMLGVVRIYSHKVNYVQKEAEEAARQLLQRQKVMLVKSLAGGKESSVAVTMEVTAKVGASHINEADFDDVVDILLPQKAAKGAADEEWTGEWFQAEASQFQDLTRNYTQDDIAKLKEDLLGPDAGRGEYDSTSTGTKKSSSAPSMEKGRASGAVAAVDELDVGMPLLEDGNAFFGEGMDIVADDPFAQPNMTTTPPNPEGEAAIDGAMDLAAEEQHLPKPKKVKIVSIVDERSTCFDYGQIRASLENRKDITAQEQRHGPRTLAEVGDRKFMKDCDSSAVYCNPVSSSVHSGLAGIFSKVVQQATAKAVEQVEEGRATIGRPSDAPHEFLADEDPAMIGQMGDQMLPDFDFNPEDVPQPLDGSGKKRGRDSDVGGLGFSVSTHATLDALRAALKKSPTMSFSRLIEGKTRIQAARCFVDTLVLASHERIAVHQAEPFGDITMKRTDHTNQALVASA